MADKERGTSAAGISPSSVAGSEIGADGASRGLLEMMGSATCTRAPNPEEAAAVTEEVIECINREFPANVLQRPTEAERARVSASIATAARAAVARHGLAIPAEAMEKLCADLGRRLMGLGFLDLLLPPARTDLSEIAIYSSGLIQVIPKGEVRWQTIDLEVPASEIWRVLDRLLGPQNKVLNEANPSVSGRLPATEHNPGGGRVKALHPAIVPPGRNPAINIRLFEQAPVRPEWLIEKGLASEDIFDFLEDYLGDGNRILITGGTRTGKTTLLSALCNYLPEDWRIVLIEDPREIWIDRPTVQSIEARPAAIGTEVRPYTLADGVDDALRLSPDYLVVGEVRDGKAALALFRALMTGHAGMSTFHAESAAHAVERLATVMGADAGVSRRDALEVIAASIDLIIHLGIPRDVRRVVSIEDVERDPEGRGIYLRRGFRYTEGIRGSPSWVDLGLEDDGPEDRKARTYLAASL